MSGRVSLYTRHRRHSIDGPRLPIEAGLFASRFGEHLFERYTMYVIPLLILVLIAWLARGLPRPMVASVVGVAVPVAAIAAFVLVEKVIPRGDLVGRVAGGGLVVAGLAMLGQALVT